MSRMTSRARSSMLDSSMLDDRKLLQLWQAGDRKAGEELYNRHHETVLRFFMRLVYDTSEVQALVSDTFMTLLKSAFRGQSPQLRAFILGIARNKLFEYIRSKKRRERLVEPGVDPHDDDITMDSLGTPDPAAFVEVNAERRLLLKAMRRLPVDAQLVLILVFWEDMTRSELAEIFGVPVGTATSRLRLAREKVHKQLLSFEENPELVETTRTTFAQWWDDLKTRAADLVADDAEPGDDETGDAEPGDDE